MHARQLLSLFKLATYFAPNSTVSPALPPSLAAVDQALHLDSPFADKMVRGPVLCISHGGGPMPLLGDVDHASIVESLRTRAPGILSLSGPSSSSASSTPPPRAIILVTAHWQTRDPTISSGPAPQLYYDYGGFPREAYTLKYPAPGSPAVATELHALLAAAGFNATLDPVRGWDHGVFVPMTLIHPAADVPIVQLSILADQDPERHLALGRALAPLRESNVAVVGSGFASFHNRRHMLPLFAAARSPVGPGREQYEALRRVGTFNELLVEAMALPHKERDLALQRWRDFEGAYDAHPDGGADHFMPLIVCAGASLPDEQVGKYRDDFLGAPIWSFYWGAANGQPADGPGE